MSRRLRRVWQPLCGFTCPHALNQHEYIYSMNMIYQQKNMCKLYVRYCRRKFSEVKTFPTDIWTDEKQRDVKSKEKRREEKRREEKRREERKSEKRKARKPRNTVICGSGGSKSRLAKAAGAEPSGQMRDEKSCTTLWRGAKHISKSKRTKHAILGALLKVDMSKKCAPLWPEAHLQVKKLKTPHARTAFGS